MSIVPEIITLQQMLERLQGICGRTFLLGHLKETPFYDGVPTYHRIGNKIVFYPDDVKALMASFEPQPKRPKHLHHELGDVGMSHRKKLARSKKLLETSGSKKKRVLERAG